MNDSIATETATNADETRVSVDFALLIIGPSKTPNRTGRPEIMMALAPRAGRHPVQHCIEDAFPAIAWLAADGVVECLADEKSPEGEAGTSDNAVIIANESILANGGFSDTQIIAAEIIARGLIVVEYPIDFENDVRNNRAVKNFKHSDNSTDGEAFFWMLKNRILPVRSVNSNNANRAASARLKNKDEMAP